MSTGERRAELDGVRGVAILLVLIGHAWGGLGLGPMAAAGVTLFFVLSGYLITGILVRERTLRGRVNLRRFYWRRLTRLGPPLLVMLAVITAWSGGLPWRNLAHPLTWTGNLTQVTGWNAGPFGHTWSLAVEEQFYLLWPVALGALLARRRPVRTLAWVVVALLLWRALLLGVGALEWAYVGPETAGSAMLAGCLVALAQWQLSGLWAAVALVLLVAGWVVVAVYAGADTWLFVPLAASPSAAVLVAAAGNARWLRARALTACGVVSYSVYLWHEPVRHVTGVAGPSGYLLGVGVGLVAYFLVEAPLMRWRSRQPHPRHTEGAPVPSHALVS